MNSKHQSSLMVNAYVFLFCFNPFPSFSCLAFVFRNQMLLPIEAAAKYSWCFPLSGWIKCTCDSLYSAIVVRVFPLRYIYTCATDHITHDRHGRHTALRPTWSWYVFFFAHLQLPRQTRSSQLVRKNMNHDDVIKWEHFPCYWPFVREIHWWPVDSPQMPVTRSFAVFFDPRLKKWLSKQSRRRWFETLLRSLWCHRFDIQHTRWCIVCSSTKLFIQH